MQIKLESTTEGVLSFSDYLNPLLPVRRVYGADIDVAKGGFGHLVFQRIQEKNYAITYNDFFIEQPHRFIYSGSRPLLAMLINLTHNRIYDTSTFGRLLFYERAVNFLYMPEVVINMDFRRPGHYTSFMLHFMPQHLERFQKAYPPMAEFLEKVKKEEPALLWPRNGIASHEMLKIVNDFIRPVYQWPTRELYEENKIKEIFAVATLCEPELEKNVYHLPEEEVDLVYRIKVQLMKRLDKPPIMPELAESFGITEYKLNALFKRIYGVTVPDFLKYERMDLAQQLLIENEKSESEIALLTGYSSIQAFSLAYKNHFGYVPHKEKRYYGD